MIAMNDFNLEELEEFKNKGVLKGSVLTLDSKMVVEYEDKDPDNTDWESHLHAIKLLLNNFDTHGIMKSIYEPRVNDALILSVLHTLQGLIKQNNLSGIYDEKNTFEVLQHYLVELKTNGIDKDPYYLRLVDKFEADDTDDDLFDFLDLNKPRA